MVIKKTPNFRIGVGARMESPNQTSLFLEVFLRLCGEHGALDLDSLKRGLGLLKKLSTRGYSLKCEEGGDISGERQVSQRNLAIEIETIDSLMTRHSGPTAG